MLLDDGRREVEKVLDLQQLRVGVLGQMDLQNNNSLKKNEFNINCFRACLRFEMDVSLPDGQRDDGGVKGPEGGPHALPVLCRAHRLLPAAEKRGRVRFRDLKIKMILFVTD